MSVWDLGITWCGSQGTFGWHADQAGENAARYYVVARSLAPEPQVIKIAIKETAYHANKLAWQLQLNVTPIVAVERRRVERTPLG